MQTKETVVISVGGSLICPPAGIDAGFLRKFRALIEAHARKGFRFVIITGGGRTAREYQNAARELKVLNREDLDWLGIHSTRLNGHLMRTLLRAQAYPVIITNAGKLKKTSKPVIIAAGGRPGRSTDYEAVSYAKRLGVKKIINLSNIDHVYTKDPKKYPDASPIKEIPWRDFRKMIPTKWDPGIHAPFDPVASRDAQKAGIEVAIMDGANLSELTKYLAGKPFKGTRIS